MWRKLKKCRVIFADAPGFKFICQLNTNFSAKIPKYKNFQAKFQFLTFMQNLKLLTLKIGATTIFAL